MTDITPTLGTQISDCNNCQNSYRCLLSKPRSNCEVYNPKPSIWDMWKSKTDYRTD